MGLAGVKKRKLVSTDPNNNTWARNTDTFGQKILRAHGWAPGDYLGAKDTAYVASHTEASLSHIRVVLKEDNLGLGAKRNNGDQCTGLDAFQNLLGRLNGKTEEVLEVEREARATVKRNLYVERKYGVMRFVQGGWLVGDQETDSLEQSKPSTTETSMDVSEASDTDVEMPDQPTQDSKKRKADDTAERKKSKKRRSEDDSGAETEKEKRKREKKAKKSKKRKENGDDTAEDESKLANEKKKKRKESKREKNPAAEPATSDVVRDNGFGTELAGKESKKEKPKAKESRESKNSGDSGSEEKRSKTRRKAKDTLSNPVDNATIQKVVSTTPTPTASGTSTPIRHLSRQRFIAQKKLAFADPKALAQIFMIKPES